MPDLDVTASVLFGNNDDELLPITQCVCGATFGYWEFCIGVYPEHTHECPECGRKLYFSVKIKVFEKADDHMALQETKDMGLSTHTKGD